MCVCATHMTCAPLPGARENTASALQRRIPQAAHLLECNFGSLLGIVGRAEKLPNGTGEAKDLNTPRVCAVLSFAMRTMSYLQNGWGQLWVVRRHYRICGRREADQDHNQQYHPGASEWRHRCPEMSRRSRRVHCLNLITLCCVACMRRGAVKRIVLCE